MSEDKKTTETKIVKEIITKKLEKIIIGVREYNGKRYAQIRTWFKPAENSPVFYPTKKGVTVRMELLTDVIGGLCDMAEQENVNVPTPKGDNDESQLATTR